MSDRAYPGEAVAPLTCGFRYEDGYCGAPVAYEIEFAGWAAYERAGACVRHAQEARQLDVKRIWSVSA